MKCLPRFLAIALTYVPLATAIILRKRAKRGRIPDQLIGMLGTRYDLVADPDAVTLLRATPEDDGIIVTSIPWKYVIWASVLPVIFFAKKNTPRR